MIANIIILLFILGLTYWMALQGFFTAFLHLIVVVVAGALALALYEPLVFNLGMKMQPQYAWGLWLLGPFAILLVVLRLLVDRLIRKNVLFPNLVSNILGGACGLFAGILTSGITLMGLGFLPLPANLAGLQPYAVGGNGQVVQGSSGLWIPVDSMTNRFFDTLSAGAFSTSTPMAIYQPQLAEQAHLYRMRYDENASVVALPQSVEVTGVFAEPVPVEQIDAAAALKLGEALKNTNNKIVVVDTRWKQTPGTYDIDGGLRLPPTQIRLVAQASRIEGGQWEMHAPMAFSRVEGDARTFTAFETAAVQAFGNRQTEYFAWVFVIPANQTPEFVLIRHLRIDLPEAKSEPATLARIVGTPAKPAEAAAGPSEVQDRQGIMAGNVAREIEINNRLPRETSKNFAPSLRVQDNGVVEGTATVSGNPGNLSQTTRINSIYTPSHMRAVRLLLKPDRAKSLLGHARVQAAQLQGVWLTDSRNEKYMPYAYVWFKGGEQEIHVDRNTPIMSAANLPVTKMSDTDELYLYFFVPPGTTIQSYNIGETTTQKIEPPLVVQ